MNCAEVRERLAAYEERSGEAHDALVEGHLSVCSGCRTDLACFQELGLRLASLAQDPMEPPSWLLPTLIDMVSNRARSGRALPRRAAQLADPRVALAGGALLVAGVAGVVAIRVRRRRNALRRKLRTGLAHA
ncbi:MAG: hypothetical protein ACRDJG_04410 [Actinomycetota bacterium]